MKIDRTSQIFIAISLIFLVVYCLLSIVPHYNFHSNAFDLGIFNQTLYDYAHFNLGPNTIRGVPTLLADHFEPILFLFAPFYWIFGSYTLLIIQILSIILGGLGVYLLLKRETKNFFLILGGVSLFYLSFGIFQALAFDYHNNVVATMLVPWLLYFISNRNFRAYYIVLILFLICKENMALMSVFLGLSIIIFEPKEIRKHGVITFFVSVIYFVLVLKIVIPFFNNGLYDHWAYAQLGSTPLEAVKNIFIHPIRTISLLFNDPIKLKMWLLILLSGGIFVLFKPKYGLIIIPILAQKFFSDNTAFWGYIFHYSVEFAPLIAIGATIAIIKIKPDYLRNGSMVFLLLINLGIISKLHFYDDTKLGRLLTADYYSIPARNEIQNALKLIPSDKSVSAQNTLVPHLADRDNIFNIPLIKNSDYIILNLNESNVWPLQNTNELLNFQKEKIEPKYTKIYDANGIILYKKSSS